MIALSKSAKSIAENDTRSGQVAAEWELPAACAEARTVHRSQMEGSIALMHRRRTKETVIKAQLHTCCPDNARPDLGGRSIWVCARAQKLVSNYTVSVFCSEDERSKSL